MLRQSSLRVNKGFSPCIDPCGEMYVGTSAQLHSLQCQPPEQPWSQLHKDYLNLVN